MRDNKKGKRDVYGILYDTYQKDWSKAYQLTFHCFFRSMDYLSNYMAGESFSYAHGDLRFFAFGKNYQFGEVITKEVEDLLGDKAKLDSLHGLPKHDKAPLYDVIFKVLDSRGYSHARYDKNSYWDDPADQEQIRAGIELYKHTEDGLELNANLLGQVFAIHNKTKKWFKEEGN